MKITEAEFQKIRPLQWSLKNFGDDTYYTVNNELDTQLFWIDFIKNVYAPRFANQRMITTINNFDYTQSVLFNTNTGEIILPSHLDVIDHASKVSALKNVEFPIRMEMVLLVAMIFYFILAIVVFIIPYKNYSNMI